MEFMYEDCKSLLKQVNLQEKELRHKRRWLIGLPSSRNEAGKLKESTHQPERPIPEYLLREDDVAYETIRSYVTKLAEEHDSKKKHHLLHDDMQLTHSPTDITALLYLINDMTNQGLFQFAKLLTNGSANFNKTRWQMKQVIKEHLSKTKTRQIKLSNDHLSLLKNPQNFRWNPESRFIPDSDSGSSRSAVHRILNIFEDLPSQTLLAMHRKLRGINDYIPKLTPKKSGWKVDMLIEQLRIKCSRFLSDLNEGDSLQEPLAKAMEVASLTLKLIQGHYYTPNFIQFPQEIITLQNEIAMCIKLLDQKVKLKLSHLKKIKTLLDPDAKVSERSFRISLKNFLMQYLFECGDIDSIPRALFKVLAIIRKSIKDDYRIDGEVECILSVSSSMKQVLWDVIPEYEFDFDLDFDDVYMEHLEESEDEEENVENTVSSSSKFDEEVGSTGETTEFNSDSVIGMGIGSAELDSLNGLKVEKLKRYHLVSFGNVDEMKMDDVMDTDDEGSCENRYLGVQSTSDEASMVAYRLIGLMLGDFARVEGCELKNGDLCYLGVGNTNTHKEDGCSIMIKAVEEIIPSFAKSETDRLKEVMGFKIQRQ